mmetsp:Transcript_71860/g.216010  ORF Transcript_71860/g.216010 Transcript_71860/m.216010 type:complete len:228 (+) Transcript_71860:2196-2879(+)
MPAPVGALSIGSLCAQDGRRDEKGDEVCGDVEGEVELVVIGVASAAFFFAELKQERRLVRDRRSTPWAPRWCSCESVSRNHCATPSSDTSPDAAAANEDESSSDGRRALNCEASASLPRVANDWQRSSCIWTWRNSSASASLPSISGSSAARACSIAFCGALVGPSVLFLGLKTACAAEVMHAPMAPVQLILRPRGAPSPKVALGLAAPAAGSILLRAPCKSLSVLV